MSGTGALISEYPFTRTGLLGFVGPGGLVFIAGKMDGLMVVSGRRHNADDIVATALAVEPMKFVYRGRSVDDISDAKKSIHFTCRVHFTQQRAPYMLIITEELRMRRCVVCPQDSRVLGDRSA